MLERQYHQAGGVRRRVLASHGVDPRVSELADCKLQAWVGADPPSGGFNVGSASEPIHNPVAFVEWSASQGLPVIAVGVNYRLGPFGFLYSSDLDGARSAAFRGNFGLRDQRMALDWIHRNIEGFGGDSDRITIVGQSAGGCE